MTRIFISHSHSDEPIAKKLIDYLFAALTVEEEDILCTSVPNTVRLSEKYELMGEFVI